jgi:hypothetical protein
MSGRALPPGRRWGTLIADPPSAIANAYPRTGESCQPCEDDLVANQAATPGDLDRLVEHMFDQVFTESERAELLVWIHRWEAENPEVDSALRVTGWIDVAYSFQARIDRADEYAGTVRPAEFGRRNVAFA